MQIQKSMAQVIELKPAGSSETVNKANKAYLAGDYPRAGAMAETYLLEHPDDAQALTILAACLKQGNRVAVAYHLARRATELRPDRSETWVCLGHCAQNLWRMDESLSCYRKALQRAQTTAQKALYNNNIGSVYLDLGQFEKAEGFVRESLKLDPNEKNTRHNLGLCLLAKREWEEAWKWYSASIGSSYRAEFRYGKEPTWDGKPGGTVVVYGEQGLGDEICAASAAPDILKAQTQAGGRLILDCDKRLENLFRRSFPGATVHGTRWEKQLAWPEGDRKIDASISGFEVLKHFRKSEADFRSGAFLVPCPDRTAMWRAYFQKKRKPAIGIAWTGGTWKNAGSYRKVPLKDWQPIFDSIDAHWVSLQYKDAAAEIEGTPVTQYPWATLSKDYDDTAAMVAALDLVISVPTTVVHLSSALGVPTIAMKAPTPCWKFAGDSLAFHPDAKLIANSGDWKVTVRETADAIRGFLQASGK
jgi:Flp pilus assembly protein TadD